MATWPATLPQRPLREGFQEQTVDILLRSPMDAGPPKTRPRYRSAPRDFALPMVLTTAQRATLETFYETTLNFGVDPFDWVHPVEETSAELMFIARPGYTSVAGGFWRTLLQLRIWP